MMKKSLKDKLPKYSPSDRLWDAISKDLQGEKDYRASLSNLPEYTPPDRVWLRLSQSLMAPESNLATQKTTKIYWQVAAAIALLVAATFVAIWYNQSQANEETYYYATEPVFKIWQVDADDADWASFELLEELCAARPWLCAGQSVDALIQNLTELNLAVQEIYAVVGEHNTDPDIIRKLREVELERTQVFKKIIGEL